MVDCGGSRRVEGGFKRLRLVARRGINNCIFWDTLGIGWGAYRFAIAMFLVVFSAVPQLAFGILLSICAIARRRVMILTSSVISLLWFLFFAIKYIDWTSYLLACLVGIVGGIFGGLLLEKKKGIRAHACPKTPAPLLDEK